MNLQVPGIMRLLYSLAFPEHAQEREEFKPNITFTPESVSGIVM